MNRYCGIMLCTAMLCLQAGTWQSASAEIGVTDKLSLSGWGWVSAGRFYSTYLNQGIHDVDFDEVFTEDIHLGLKLTARPHDNWTINLHAGGFFQQTGALWNYGGVPVGKLLKTYLIQARGRGAFGDSARVPTFVELGYFPIKYNADSRNLGEYLFRSGTYPPYVVSGFELADKVKGLGIRGGLSLFGCLHQEAMLTSQMDMFPFYDLSLAYQVRYSRSRVFEVGGGIMASRLIPVDEQATTPGKGYSEEQLAGPEFSLVGVVDPETGDTVLLTFQGGKAALHMAVQPFANVESDLLGEDDLRLYGEVALLGFKDYPVWYDEISERVPVTLGLNLPTHPLVSWGSMAALSLVGTLQADHTRIVVPGSHGATAAWVGTGLVMWALNRFFKLDTWLDLLALEVEYYSSPWLNTPQGIVKSRSPAPYADTPVPQYDLMEKHRQDDWKWSLYASKQISSFLKISAVIANDNMRRGRYGGGYDYPITVGPTDWYWMLRTKFYF